MLEAYVSELTLLTAICIFVSALAIFPQAYKMFRRKSSRDVAISTYLMLFPSYIIFALFGLSLNSISLALANIIGLLGTLLVIILYYRYEKKKHA